MRTQPGHLVACLVAGLALAAPCAAQTVIPPDSAPRPRADTARGGGALAPRADTGAARVTPAPQPQPPATPAPAPAAAPASAWSGPPGVCSDDAAPGELSADVLAVIFLRRADSTARVAAIKGVGGQLLGPDIAGEGPHFVRVPSGGSEARLQALADRMIRMKPVSEVGPVPCPGRQQPVDTTRQKR